MADETNLYTDVLIDGRVYRLQGAAPEELHRAAGLINKKIADVKKLPGFYGLDQSYRDLMLNLNLASEYFAAETETENLKNRLKEREDELYAARHELVGLKLKLENALKEVDLLEKRLDEQSSANRTSGPRRLV